jgi:hypothetical protein
MLGSCLRNNKKAGRRLGLHSARSVAAATALPNGMELKVFFGCHGGSLPAGAF